MPIATAPVELRSCPDSWGVRYGSHLNDCRPLGGHGAFLLTFECGAGSYPGEPTSDFVLTMLRSGGFAADFGLGPGRYSVEVAPGQLLLAPPFTPTEHHFRQPAKGMVLALAHARVAKLLQDSALAPARLRELHLRPLRDEFIRSTLRQLDAAARSTRLSDSLFVESAVLGILARLVRHGENERRTRRGLAGWQLRRVTERFESMADVSLADLAAAANLSPWHFARAFKQTTGLPPHRYQVVRRIERAKQLLAQTRLPITQVALAVGYGSSQALARVFRTEVGLSPIEFRRSEAE